MARQYGPQWPSSIPAQRALRGLPQEEKPQQRAAGAFASANLTTLFIVLLIAGAITNSDSTSHSDSIIDIDTCADGEDNDGDGLTDELDAECDPTHPEYDGEENDGGV